MFASQPHVFSPKGVIRLSFTARMGRVRSYRARSASKKDGLVTPYPFFSDRALHEHRRHLVCPLYFTRNGFEFSPEAVVTVRRTRPFFPPCGTTAVMLLLVCLNCAG